MQISNFAEKDIVISGLAIHLPGIDEYEKFATTLFEGLPLRPPECEKIPSGYHGDFPAPGCQLAKSNELDTVFFGMNTAVFKGTDRVQMKGLETCFEALMDAGINAEEVKNYVSEVFMNTARADGESIDLKSAETRYLILGYCRALAPNRVSFHFDHHGHSVSLDNGNAGGMRSLELGWRDIKEGRSDLAIVSAGNLFFSESTTAQMDDLGWLSKSGNTCSFDNEADGFRRTEGFVTLILQKAKHAKRIYAKVHHVCCESVQSLHTSPFTPSEECWLEFLKNVYADGKIPVERIQYLEAYGAAIKEWDASELNAAIEFFGGNRESPLIVGSVKSNIGHSEGAADLVSIVKAIICLENNKVPGNRNYRKPNVAIPSLINGQFKVADKTMALRDDALIAVNTYSYGNIYGHCILEGFKKPKPKIAEEIPRLVLLSGRIDDFLPRIIHQVEENVPFDTEYISLLHELFKNDFGQHLAKGYTILPKKENSISQHQTIDGEKRQLWFVFSGMGSQWPGMGVDLMKLPIARESIEKCHRILKSKGVDLIQILTSNDQNTFKLNLNSFVGIAAIQIALVDVLNALNIVPDGIIGHSLGEVGCAYADGSLDLEQTILAAYYRGKAVNDATLKKGAMAAIGKGYREIKDELPDNVEVACHNSSTSSTISGLEEPVLQLVDGLQKKGVFAKVVEAGEIGFHSQFIEPAGTHLLNYMKNVIKIPKLRSKKWVSSSVPEANWSEDAALYSSAAYFTNNLLMPVLFEEACTHIPDNALLLEIAPHGLLQAILKRSFPNGVNISLTSRAAPDNFIFLLKAIGRLYMAGVFPDVAALYPTPNFPVGTKTSSLGNLFPWCTIAKQGVSTIAARRVMNLPKLIRKFDELLGEHVFRGKNTAPVSYYPYLAWHSFYQSDPANLNLSFFIKDLRIFKPFDLSIGRDLTVEALTLPESDLTEITKDESLIASAITVKLQERVMSLLSTDFLQAQDSLTLTKLDVYDLLAKKGYHLSKNLQFLKSVVWVGNGVRATMTFTADWVEKLEALIHLAYLYVTEDGLVTVHKIGRIEVDMTSSGENGRGNNKEDLELFYNPATNEMSTNGIYVKDMIFKVHSDSCILPIESILPYERSPLKTIEEYVQFCGQIMSNLGEINAISGGIKILEAQDQYLPEIAPVIESIFAGVKVDSIPNDSNWSTYESKAKYDLVVGSYSNIQKHISKITCYGLVRGNETLEQLTIPEDFAVVSSLSLGKEDKITLIKKKITLNGEAQFITIPEKENDLIATLMRCQKCRNNALLVGYREPSNGVIDFIERINSKTSMILKWMFILDESAPKFSVEEPFYKQQLEKGLSLNVLIKGSWSFIYRKQLESPCNKMGCIDRNTTGKDIDSLMELYSGSKFTWTMPTNWSIENKEELAAAYAIAYHCIVLAANTKSWEGVLVTDGGSVIGQAAIAVALTKTNRIYATVESAEEAKKLKAIFPELNLCNILLHSDVNCIVKLKETALENFPNIIINQLEGRIAKDVFAVPTFFAKTFHLGKKEIEENYTLLSWPFQKYVSLITVSIENIPHWHYEDKESVWQLVHEGIKSGTVRPLQAIRSPPTPLSYRGQKVQQLASKCYRKNEFEIKSNGVYFILGETNGIDVDIAEWLVRRGAKNIIIYNASMQDGDSNVRKNSIIRLQRTVNLQILDQFNIRKFLSGVKSQSILLDAVLYIHLVDKEESSDVAKINAELRNAGNHFVAISRNRQFALKIQKYISAESSAMNVVWNNEKELIGRNMDALISLLGEHSFISTGRTSSSHLYDYGAAISDLIPNSLESIQLIGTSLPSGVQLLELPTSGLLKENCTAECQPVFIFPGVEDDNAESTKTLALGLLAPAFVVQVPSSEHLNIDTVSAAVIEKMINVTDRRIYNLVGLSTGCIFAMEVARQLEEKGRIVSIVLADNPLHLLRENGVKRATNPVLLDVLASLSPQETETPLTACQTSDLQFEHVVSSMGLAPLTESMVVKGIKHISTYLDKVCNYDAIDLKLKGPLTVLRSETYSAKDIAYNEVCGNKYILDMPMEHRTLLKSKELQAIINKAIILDDASLKSVHELLWVAFEDILEKYRSVRTDEGLAKLW